MEVENGQASFIFEGTWLLIDSVQTKNCVWFFSGTPIFLLDRKSMKCFEFPVWNGILIGSVVLVLVTLALITNRKWEAVKFCLFMKHNLLINDDGPENLEDMEFDAFVAYRYVAQI